MRPHARFLALVVWFLVLSAASPARAEEYKIPLKIGATLEWKRSKNKPGRLKVVKIEKGSAAERLGYHKGDEIIAIDGEPVGSKTVQAFMGLSLDAKSFRVRRKNRELDLPVLFRATGFIAGSEGDVLKPGQPPPALETTTWDGKPVSLGGLTGRVVLLNFWATWCKPCVAEMPELIRIQERFGLRDFLVLSINLDDDLGTLEKYLKNDPLPFPVVHSPGMGSKIPSRYGVRVLPTNVILDRDGTIMQVSTGYRLQQQEAHLGKAIQTLLQSGPSKAAPANQR